MDQNTRKGKVAETDAEVEVGTGGVIRRTAMTDLQREHAELALKSSEHLVNRLICESGSINRKLLFVLSYPDRYVRERIDHHERWDEEFVNFLKATGLPVVDLSDEHLNDYRESYRCSPEQYLARFYSGHYNPMGNHFQAIAIRESLLSLLRPRAPTYG